MNKTIISIAEQEDQEVDVVQEDLDFNIFN